MAAGAQVLTLTMLVRQPINYARIIFLNMGLFICFCVHSCMGISVLVSVFVCVYIKGQLVVIIFLLLP